MSRGWDAVGRVGASLLERGQRRREMEEELKLKAKYAAEDPIEQAKLKVYAEVQRANIAAKEAAAEASRAKGQMYREEGLRKRDPLPVAVGGTVYDRDPLYDESGALADYYNREVGRATSPAPQEHPNVQQRHKDRLEQRRLDNIAKEKARIEDQRRAALNTVRNLIADAEGGPRSERDRRVAALRKREEEIHSEFNERLRAFDTPAGESSQTPASGWSLGKVGSLLGGALKYSTPDGVAQEFAEGNISADQTRGLLEAGGANVDLSGLTNVKGERGPKVVGGGPQAEKNKGNPDPRNTPKFKAAKAALKQQNPDASDAEIEEYLLETGAY